MAPLSGQHFERVVKSGGGAVVSMAIDGMGGYSGPSNGMQLMRNESTSDSLAAMLGPPGLQGG